jgi:hypothetical protein
MNKLLYHYYLRIYFFPNWYKWVVNSIPDNPNLQIQLTNKSILWWICFLKRVIFYTHISSDVYSVQIVYIISGTCNARETLRIQVIKHNVQCEFSKNTQDSDGLLWPLTMGTLGNNLQCGQVVHSSRMLILKWSPCNSLLRGIYN